MMLISYTNKVMLKILQARLQKYMNWKTSDVQLNLQRQRNQRSNCQCYLDQRKNKGIKKKKKKNYFCYTDYVKAFDCVDHSLRTVENS